MPLMPARKWRYSLMRMSVIERTVFGHVADASSGLDRVPEDVDAVDGRLSGRRGEIPGQDAHGRRFARSVGPEKADDLAGGHVEAHVLNRGVVAVILGQFANVNHVNQGWRGQE